MPIKLRLFGVPQFLDVATNQWTPLPLDNRGALLVYLAQAESWVSREQAAFLFWPDTDDASARSNLRQLISRTRKLSLAAELETSRTNMGWFVETDVAAFLEAKDNEVWQTTLEVATGQFCDGLNDVSSGMLAWLELERSSLNNIVNSIRHTHSQYLIAKGDYNQAAITIEPLVKDNIASEDIIQDYLRCLYLAGKRDVALKAYGEFEKQLEVEFGLEPLPETKALVAKIEASQNLDLATRNTEQTNNDLPEIFLHPPNLIGRHEALQKLENSVHKLTVVKGEAGIGKTRFVQTVHPNSHVLSCEEGLQHIPYQPIVAFIRSHLVLTSSMPDLGPYQNDLARLIPELSTNAETLADPMAGQIRLVEAIARFVEGVCKDIHSTVFIDDVQWADEKTIEFIVFLAKRQVEKNTKLVLTYRTNEASPELLQAINSIGAVNTIELDSLSKEQLQSFIEENIQLASSELNTFSAWLHSATAGNPMFVLELLKSLYESGSIKSSEQNNLLNNSKLALSDSIESIKSSTTLSSHISERIASLIHKRLERLSPEANRLLQSMAVASELNLQQLGSVASLSDWTLIDAFEELEKAGFVTDESFKHDILREVTQQHLSAAHQQLLHRRVATMLAKDLDAAMIAEHWYAANELDKAVSYWEVAVQQWVDVGLLHNATSILERLIKLETGKYLEHSLQLATYYVHIGFYPKAVSIVNTLENSKTIESNHTAQINMVLGMTKIFEGQMVEAEHHLAEAVQIGNSDLAKNFKPESIFYTRMQHALTKALVGDFVFAENTWLTLAEECNDEIPQFLKYNCYFLLAGSYARNNRIEEAKLIHDSKLNLSPDYLTYNIYFYLNYYAYKDDFKRVETLLEEAKKVLGLGFQMSTPFLLEGIIDAYMSMGQFEEAEFYINLLIEQKFPLLACAVWARQAKLFALTNRHEEAQKSLKLTLDTLSGTGYADAIAVSVIIILSFGYTELNEKIQAQIEMVRHLPVLFHFKADLEKALEAYDGGLEPYQPAIYTAVNRLHTQSSL